MGIANPYWGGNFDPDTWERCGECSDILSSEKYYLNGKFVCKKCYEKSQRMYLKLKYYELCNAYHPDHLDEKDKTSGHRVFCEIQNAWNNNNFNELENIYEKYQEAKAGELRRKLLEQQARERRNQEKKEQKRPEKERLEQSYCQPEPDDNCEIEREAQQESSYHQFEAVNFIKALVVTIALVIFFGYIAQGCPAKKEPDRLPSPGIEPRIEYVLPKTDGEYITVKSDILTEYFGISYEQRQKSDLFMKDAYEYRYNGNGTWTITKKSAVNNTDKNYIDTNNKNEVENYLHSLGF